MATVRFSPTRWSRASTVETKLSGSTRKFACAIAPDHVVKVRYGAHNREIQGSVLATRLLWALGFAADRVYPVQVQCLGCSSDPWHRRERVKGDHLFAPAVIEHRPDGYEMTDDRGKIGWSWRELDLVDESAGGAPAAQRDALKLLAVFMQHTDTKRKQQRLLCLPGGLVAGGSVRQAVSDVARRRPHVWACQHLQRSRQREHQSGEVGQHPRLEGLTGMRGPLE